MKSNLLLLLADQLRADCVGYSRAYPVATPNIDRLAAQSAVYTQAYAAMPICAPMRQALLTGRNPNRFGAITNHDITPTVALRPEDTWTARLKAQGYSGALVGNLHAPYTCALRDFGFDAYDPREDYFSDIARRYPALRYENDFFGEPSPLPVCDSMTHWTSGRVCEHVRRFSAQGAPWFVWAEFLAPHLPCRPSEPFASRYDPASVPMWAGFDDSFRGKPYMQRQQVLNWGMEGKSWPDVSPTVANYYATVTQLDDAVGQVLECLRQTGQEENTVVVFASDHGDMCGSHRMMDKGYVLYDDVVHVPLLVKRPGQAPFAADAFVSSFLDLTCSLYGWLGLDDCPPLDGLPLPSRADESRRAFATSSYNGQQFGLYCQRMLRGARYKYVWNASDVDELYDLAEDPGERNNLIDREALAPRVARMREALFEQLRAEGDWLFTGDWLKGQFFQGRKAPR